MKKYMLLVFIAVIPVLNTSFLSGQDNTVDGKIRLLVRADDIGSFHAANLGCTTSYSEGIVRSVEIMVPCPWYPEAVEMINENPGLDVGVHLVLTSEWENVKWRPVTGRTTITDGRGYFFPMVWPNVNFGPEMALVTSDWRLDDVEKELRSQIEIARKDIPSLSHLSTHMGFSAMDASIDSLVRSLAQEYGLEIQYKDIEIKRFNFSKPKEYNLNLWVAEFRRELRILEPGTYLFVEHPSLNTPEMEPVGHTGYEEVGKDRQMVTDLLTHKELIKEIEDLGIELISYADLE